MGQVSMEICGRAGSALSGNQHFGAILFFRIEAERAAMIDRLRGCFPDMRFLRLEKGASGC